MLTELACLVTTSGTATLGAYAHHLWRRLHTDPLTGLANRAALDRRHARARRFSRACPIAVLLGDIDRFKRINDTHGHRFGDRVIHTVATDLTANLRPGELAVRLHGDEFAVLLTGVTAGTAETRASQLREALTGTRVLDGQPVEVSVSIGAATAPTAISDLSQLLARADDRMYATKPTASRDGQLLGRI